MSSTTGGEWTTLGIHDSVHARLSGLKPYESMSFNDLLNDMADVYEQQENV